MSSCHLQMHPAMLIVQRLPSVPVCLLTTTRLPCQVAAVLQITMSGISTLASGQAQWRELHTQGYNPFILASQVDVRTYIALISILVCKHSCQQSMNLPFPEPLNL